MSAATFPVLLDGYTDLPPGKIANVVTFLERKHAPTGQISAVAGLNVTAVPDATAPWYRDIYRRIGEDWLWFSRAVMSDDDLGALLRAPGTEILALEHEGGTAGLVEFDFSVAGDVEIVTFGVVPELTGTGAARMLMESALRYAFRPGARRVWLHTCSFDHPAAVKFYRARGFEAYKFAIEVSDDPRRAGLLPESAAPHVPYIR